jgi:hypothetical protein
MVILYGHIKRLFMDRQDDLFRQVGVIFQCREGVNFSCQLTFHFFPFRAAANFPHFLHFSLVIASTRRVRGNLAIHISISFGFC